MADEKELTCARCGGATTPGTAVCSALRVAATASNPTGKVTVATAPASSIFCSDRCMSGSIATVLARASCTVCGKRWNRGVGEAGGGRNDVTYCSETCVGVHRKLLRRAAKELAKGTMPKGSDAIDEAIAVAYSLDQHWWTPAPHLVPCPDDRARRALARRLTDLSRLREEAAAERAAKFAADRRREAERRYQAQKKAEEAQDRAWRDALA